MNGWGWYRPRFMWDVGASEQDITNIMQGVGGRGGYGTLSPPAMGWYGSESSVPDDVSCECESYESGGFSKETSRIILALSGGVMLALAIKIYIDLNRGWRITPSSAFQAWLRRRLR